ncbi:MAG TPA: pyrrolo-quinoline quinone [Clostridia bacterium]|nr:pyrrolo-quinoline quinone [Clostridia bacterium]
MGRQTRRKFRRSPRYGLRRFLVAVVFLGVVASLVIFLPKLFKKGSGSVKDGNSEPTTPPSMSLPEPTPTPMPTLSEGLTIQKGTAESFSDVGFSSSVMANKQEVASYSREVPITFGIGADYSKVKGIITFGGSNYRSSFTYGTATVTQKTLTRVWAKDIGSLNVQDYGTWTGTGWTGMPLIVQWDDDVLRTLGVFDQYKNKPGFTEVIYPTMDGNIYFWELESGEKTREPIHIGVVTKGTASLDPRGYPLLYTGQGIPSDVDGTGAWFRIISLIDNKVLKAYGGEDPFSYRKFQAYDSSALVDGETDTLIQPSENGVLYTVKLNTKYDSDAGTVSVDPDPLTKYRYTANGYGEGNTNRWWGIENSIAVWREYAFFTDNGGYLQCLNLNTLEPQYIVDVLDDSDASIVIEEDPEKQTFYLYTANEVDKQTGITNGLGKNVHRKIDGLTGNVLWEKTYDANVGRESSNGGTLTTAHVGHGNISNIVIYTSTLLPVTVNGESTIGARLIAYDKVKGDEIWRYEQANGYWSSPVVVYDQNENAYLIQCDRGGIMRIHDPRDGKVLYELDIGSRIESTPAVFNNMIVVGTRGQAGSGDTPKVVCVRLG